MPLKANGHTNDEVVQQKSSIKAVSTSNLPKPPDGGYGWVVLFAAFMCNLILHGICYSFANFKPSYSKEFGTSDALTALIGSLLFGVYLIVGPIVGGLVNKFGSRVVVIAGAVLSALAFLGSTFSTNIFVFLVLFGVVGGIGFGMIYLPAIVTVGYYFERKRALATGIVHAGSGVGAIVMPILAEFCISNFGWRMAVGVLACLIATCCGFGALFRPLAALDEGNSCERVNQTHEALLSANSKQPISKSRAFTVDDGTVLKVARTQSLRHSSIAGDGNLNSSRQSLGGRPSRIAAKSLQRIGSHEAEEFAKPMNRRDIFYEGSLCNLKEFVSEGKDLHAYRDSVVSVPAAALVKSLENFSERITSKGEAVIALETEELAGTSYVALPKKALQKMLLYSDFDPHNTF